MKYKLLTFSILILLFYGCRNEKESYIKEIIGSELKMNIDLMIRGCDSELFPTDMDKQLKIVVYSDSSNCNACDLRFPLWKIRYKELSRENNIGLIFVINTENIDDVELNANVSQVPGLKFFDITGIFKVNNHISHHQDLHVFLLDQNNKVILVGNPLDNDNLFVLYRKAIEMHTNH